MSEDDDTLLNRRAYIALTGMLDGDICGALADLLDSDEPIPSYLRKKWAVALRGGGATTPVQFSVKVVADWHKHEKKIRTRRRDVQIAERYAQLREQGLSANDTIDTLRRENPTLDRKSIERANTFGKKVLYAAQKYNWNLTTDSGFNHRLSVNMALRIPLREQP